MGTAGAKGTKVGAKARFAFAATIRVPAQTVVEHGDREAYEAMRQEMIAFYAGLQRFLEATGYITTITEDTKLQVDREIVDLKDEVQGQLDIATQLLEMGATSVKVVK